MDSDSTSVASVCCMFSISVIAMGRSNRKKLFAMVQLVWIMLI